MLGSDLGFVLVLGLMLVLVSLMPIPIRFDLLIDQKEAEDFLSTLWQVLAAMLALSVAVILFLFQAVGGSRPTGGLREFAEDSHLFKFLDFGVLALLMVGGVLLGLGRGAPGGWAGTWATFLGGVSILSLAFLFRLALRAVSTDRLHEQRLLRLRRRAVAYVERAALAERANALLADVCSSAGIDYEPIFHQPPVGSRPVRSPASGMVADINLRRLTVLAERVRGGNGEIALVVLPGQDVASDRPLLYWSGEASIGTLLDPQRLFWLRTDGTDDLSDALEQVHAEALEAIRVGDPLLYGQTSSLYRELFASFARGWATYGAEPPSESSFSFLDDPVRRLTQSLYEEMRLAYRSDSREIMFAATAFPTRAAQEAFRYGQINLARNALRLSLHSYRLAQDQQGSEVAEIARDLAWRYLVEHAESLGFRLTSRDEDLAEKTRAIPFITLTFVFLGEMLKEMIDHRDLPSIKEVDGRWRDFLTHWSPEHGRPNEWDIEVLERKHGPDHASVAEARRVMSANQDLAEEKAGLEDLRVQLWFGLVIWSLHRLREGQGDAVRANILRHFAARFNSLNDVVVTTNRARDSEWEGISESWSMWLLGAGSGFTSVDTKLTDTFLFLALLRTDPASPPPGIQPYDWVRFRLDDLISRLDHLASDVVVWGFLSEVSDIQQRKSKLAEALRHAAAAQQEIDDERARTEPLDPGKTQELVTAIRVGIEGHRWVPRLFERSGRFQAEGREAPDRELWLSFRQWLPRDIFLKESNFVGIDSFGEDVGRALAAGEVEAIIERAALLPPLVVGDGNARSKVEEAIRLFSSAGMKLSLVLIPVDWRLEDALGLTDPFSTVQAPEWVPKQIRPAFEGVIDGALVVSWHTVPSDRVYFFDLAEFATWRQWDTGPKGDVSKIEVTSYDSDRALELTTQYPDLFRRGELVSAEERAQELQKHLHLEAKERFTLDVHQMYAAAWIGI